MTNPEKPSEVCGRVFLDGALWKECSNPKPCPIHQKPQRPEKCNNCGYYLTDKEHYMLCEVSTSVPWKKSSDAPVAGWGGELGDILSDFEADHDEVKAVNSIADLLAKATAEARREELDCLLSKVKESSATLPLPIERSGIYAQGMHAGIDLAINEIIARIKALTGHKE